MNLLLVKMSSLGDVIHTLPLANSLRQGLNCQIFWAVNSELAPLIELCPDVAGAIAFPRSNVVGGLVPFLKELRRTSYELAIDVQGLLKSALVVYASGAKRRIGLRSAREGAPLFYTELVGTKEIRTHAVERYLEVARHLGLPDGLPVFNLKAGPGKRTRNKRLVVIHPFARWETKRWPKERFAQVADSMLAAGLAEVVFVGGPQDRGDMGVIDSLMKNKPRDLVGKISLAELANILAEADLFLANDSGPMHLAVALGCPVIALFGPTSPARTGPYGAGHQVLGYPARCRPCFLRRCPLDHSCLLKVSPEEVFFAIASILEDRG